MPSPPCGHLTTSKQWKKLHEDPNAKGQRWYCPKCEARYKTSYGHLVELRISTQWYYCSADFMDDITRDAKFILAEQQFTECKSPEQLYNAIPTVKPHETSLIHLTEKEGCYKVEPQVLKDLPNLEWMQLYNLAAST